MKRYPGYSLLEMLMVVMIIGILATLGIFHLSNFDTYKYYAESCTNKIYGDISSYFYHASTSKMLKIQNNLKVEEISPVLYEIQLLSDQNNEHVTTINFQYYQNRNDTTDANKRSILTTLPLTTLKNCQKGEKYKVHTKANFQAIRMLPGFKALGNQNGFEMKDRGGNTLFTGEIAMKFCTPTQSLEKDCYDFAKVLLDARTGILKKAFCKYYHLQDDPNTTNINEDRTCKDRSTSL